jgi:hypothetical protein
VGTNLIREEKCYCPCGGENNYEEPIMVKNKKNKWRRRDID